jgi:hypothetical protein
MPGPPPKQGPKLGHRRKTGTDRPHDLATWKDSAAAAGPVSHGRTRRNGIPIPEASERWLPISRSWYNSLKLSGQSAFYEASDWATAVAAAQAYDIFLRTYNASTLATFERLSARLGVTIVDRARARIELADPDPTDRDEEAADSAVIRWQGRLGVVED